MTNSLRTPRERFFLRRVGAAAAAAATAAITWYHGSNAGDLGSLYLAYVRDPDGNKLCAIYRPK